MDGLVVGLDGWRDGWVDGWVGLGVAGWMDGWGGSEEHGGEGHARAGARLAAEALAASQEHVLKQTGK